MENVVCVHTDLIEEALSDTVLLIVNFNESWVVWIVAVHVWFLGTRAYNQEFELEILEEL